MKKFVLLFLIFSLGIIIGIKINNQNIKQAKTVDNAISTSSNFKMEIPRSGFEKPRDDSKGFIKWIEKRPISKPILAYLFTEKRESLQPISGSFIGDDKDRDALSLKPRGKVFLTDRGALFIEGGSLFPEIAGNSLSVEIKDSNAFSIEIILMPFKTKRTSSAQIIGISKDSNKRNFSISEYANNYNIKIRVDKNKKQKSELSTVIPFRKQCITHIVITFDKNSECIYINGVKIYSEKTTDTSLANWQYNFPVVIGNDISKKIGWSGIIRFVAFYKKTLTEREVKTASQNLVPSDPGIGCNPFIIEKDSPGLSAHKQIEIF